MLKLGCLIITIQDKSREFFNLFTTIFIARKVLPPAFIYQNNSDIFQDTWLKDWEAKDEVYFIILPNNWSYNLLNLN